MLLYIIVWYTYHQYLPYFIPWYLTLFSQRGGSRLSPSTSAICSIDDGVFLSCSMMCVATPLLPLHCVTLRGTFNSSKINNINLFGALPWQRFLWKDSLRRKVYYTCSHANASSIWLWFRVAFMGKQKTFPNIANLDTSNYLKAETHPQTVLKRKLNPKKLKSGW